MRYNRRKQSVTIAILLFAVVALSVGFSTFSQTLTISSSVSVNPDSELFSVKFSASNDQLSTSEIVPATLNPSTLTATNGIIDNSMDPTISNFNVYFTGAGQSVTYEFYLMNTGNYKAYLTDFVFSEIENGSYKRCLALTDANQELVNQACESIDAILYVGEHTITSEDENVSYEIEPGAVEKITLEIKYASNGVQADGDFSIEFGDISMTFTTVNTDGEIATPEVTPSDTACFVSVLPGEINKYICEEKDVVIPNNLELAPVQIDTITLNNEKCSVVEEMLPSDCNTMSAQIPYMTNEQIFGSVLGALVDITYTETTESNPVTTIGSGAFALKDLTSINIPSSIDSVKDYAAAMSGLSEVILANGVETIGSYAFVMNQLTGDLVLPATIVSIGEYAFMGSNSIGELSFVPGSIIETIGESAFVMSIIESVIIPDSVITIGANAFYESQISNLTLGNSVEVIDEYAFSDNNITNLVIPNSVKTIGSGAFSDNTISTLILGNNVETLGSWAFSDNDITNLVIPDSVTTIEDNAFMSNNIATIELGVGITSLGSGTPFNSGGKATKRNPITSVRIKAQKAQVTLASNEFEWAEGSNCAAWTGDIKDNPCITWVNG